MAENSQNVVLDCRGYCCPIPILKTMQAVKKLVEGQVLELISSDPSSQKDLPAWCENSGVELIEAVEIEQEFHFYLKKSK
ncbi:MAG: sulfurtransferase TusA family protein [Deltaproteobacteria bacterium]|nr:sulfurtransferase TusA family protein [Deltaproteobacteria bacterium]